MTIDLFGNTTYPYGYYDLRASNGKVERWFATRRDDDQNIWAREGEEDSGRLLTTDLIAAGLTFVGPSADYLSLQNLEAAGFKRSHDHFNKSGENYEGTWSRDYWDKGGRKYQVNVEVATIWQHDVGGHSAERFFFTPTAQLKKPNPRSEFTTFNVEMIPETQTKVSSIEQFFDNMWADNRALHDKPYGTPKKAPTPAMKP